MTATPHRLFTVHGVEIEYMIVDADTLDVRPLADRLLRGADGAVVSDLEMGPVTICNELMAHLIELKTTTPAPDLGAVARWFQDTVARVDLRLGEHGARLLPSGMHPWMRPDSEAVLWPHEYGDVYATFDRIFDCRGHGWSNLQACQLNLPFADDDEFRRLHAAIRTVLPLLPALTASTPFCEGERTGPLDQRLFTYRGNSRHVPEVSGAVVPENADGRRQYELDILGRIHAAMAPHDPDGVLREEWINARGAIARFDRMAIEIRVLDAQECPRADIAILALITDLVRALAEARPPFAGVEAQRALPLQPLADLLWRCARDGGAAALDLPQLAAVLAIDGDRVDDVWRQLVDRLWPAGSAAGEPWRDVLDVVLTGGNLAQRLLHAAGDSPDRAALHRVYGRLADCLRRGELFLP